MALYLIPNGPMQTTVGFAKVTTGTALKTMLKVRPGPTQNMRVVEWGISFDGSAAALPIMTELIETGTIAGTVTASVSNDITKWGSEALAGSLDPTTNILVVNTTSTGYTCTSEGTITAVRNFDLQLVAPTNGYVKQWPLGREPVLQANNILRIRVTAGAAVNAYCYVIVEA